MTADEAFKKIKIAIDESPRNSYVAELQLQILKYAEYFRTVKGKDFCSALGIPPAYATEYSKMLKIHQRLVRAGLDVSRI